MSFHAKHNLELSTWLKGNMLKFCIYLRLRNMYGARVVAEKRDFYVQCLEGTQSPQG